MHILDKRKHMQRVILENYWAQSPWEIFEHNLHEIQKFLATAQVIWLKNKDIFYYRREDFVKAHQSCENRCGSLEVRFELVACKRKLIINSYSPSHISSTATLMEGASKRSSKKGVWKRKGKRVERQEGNVRTGYSLHEFIGLLLEVLRWVY